MSYPTALQLSRQVAWEMEGVRRAQMRYREDAVTADPTTLPPGRRMLREIMGPLVPLIAAAQDEAREMLTIPGRQPGWCWPIQLLSPAKLGVLASSVAVSRCVRGSGGEDSRTLLGMSEELAQKVRDEMEYGRWTAQQEHANKEAKRNGDEDHTDLLARLKRRYPSMDRRVWAKWRAKVDALREARWDKKEVEAPFGGKMFRLVVDAAPDYFKITERPLRGGLVQHQLELTVEALELLRDLEARAEVARPLLRPMVIPPNPWIYEEAA